MTSRKSVGSLLIFVGTVLCFFLPLVTVSCGGMKAFTLTGQQLATGTTLTQSQPFGPPQTQKIDAEPFAALAGVCAILGVILSVVGRKLSTGSAVVAGIGVISLFIMRARLDAEIQKQGQGIASVNYESGFTLLVALFIAAAGWNLYLSLKGRQSDKADIVVGNPPRAELGDSEPSSPASPSITSR